jgi:hypothetical protein
MAFCHFVIFRLTLNFKKGEDLKHQVSQSMEVKSSINYEGMIASSIRSISSIWRFVYLLTLWWYPWNTDVASYRSSYVSYNSTILLCIFFSSYHHSSFFSLYPSTLLFLFHPQSCLCIHPLLLTPHPYLKIKIFLNKLMSPL